jgi:glucose uptake protein
MEILAYGLATIFAWGLWLVPSHRVRFPNERVRTCYVAIANVVLALTVSAWRGESFLPPRVFAGAFLGGLVWCAASWAAFGATRRIGISRAMAIWAPLNIFVAFLWGAFLFREFTGWSPHRYSGLALAIALLLGGILAIVLSGGIATEQRRIPWSGFLMSLVTGILWGSYFLPIQYLKANVWAASVPLALGICAGAFAGTASNLRALKLAKRSDYFPALLSGLLWGTGNYSSLLLMERAGTGTGFALSQLCIAVNALAGILLFAQPPLRSPAARRLLTGTALAMAAGILLGLLRS